VVSLGNLQKQKEEEFFISVRNLKKFSEASLLEVYGSDKRGLGNNIRFLPFGRELQSQKQLLNMCHSQMTFYPECTKLYWIVNRFQGRIFTHLKVFASSATTTE
jgi:hypothetical protein